MNYIETFQSHAVAAGLPAGWASRWGTGTFSITEEGGDRLLVSSASGSNVRRLVSLSAIDADENTADSEVLLCLRPNSVPTQTIAGAVLRGSGNSTATAAGYGCMMYGPDKLHIVKYAAGVGTILRSTDTGPNFVANTFVWIRFRVEGTSLKAKYWTGLLNDEPVDWTAEITDASISGAGIVGLSTYAASITTSFSQVAFATNGDTATFTVDLDPPELSLATGTAASATTANGSVTTDKPNGTLFYLASTNATETAVTIKAGGARSGSMAVSSVGAKPYTVTGLSPSTLYYLHNVHTSSNSVDSDVESSSSFTTPAAEVGAPTLSSAASSQTGSSTGAAQVNTNRNSGTMYLSVLTTPTPPSAAALRAGTGAVFAQGKLVTNSGVPQTFSISGLAPSTTYYPYLHQVDGSGNESAVVSGPAFTTAASGAKGIRKSFFDGASAKANITGISAVWWDVTQPHTFDVNPPKLVTNAASTDASGVLQLSLAGVTSLGIGDTGYLHLFKLDGADRENSLEWAGLVDVVDIS